MGRAFEYRFRPTEPRTAELSCTFGCVRLVYDRALAERTRCWFTEQRRMNRDETSAALTRWKKDPDPAFLNEVSSAPSEEVLRRLQSAFRNFFDQRAQYPRRKSRKWSRTSAGCTRPALTYRDGRPRSAKTAEPLDIV